MTNPYLPPGSEENIVDKYAPRISYFFVIVIAVILIAYLLLRDVSIFGETKLRDFEYLSPILGTISFSIYVVIFQYAIIRMRKYCSAHSGIYERYDIEQLKIVIRNQMKLVYPLLASTIISLICGITMIRDLGLYGYLFMGIVMSGNSILTFRGKKWEKEIRAIVKVDEGLKEEYLELLEKWTKDKWPSF